MTNSEKFKEKLAAEFARIPGDEREKIKRIKAFQWWCSGYFLDSNNSAEKLLNERRRLFDFKTLKSIREYLDRPEVERLTFLDETIDAMELAKQHRRCEEDKLHKIRMEEAQKQKEQIDRRTAEQLKVLTPMYIEASKAELLYGYNSERCQEIKRKIKDYSKNLTYQASMTIGVVGINAMLQAAAELKKDPIKAAMVAERKAIEMLNHDQERVASCEYEYNRGGRYGALISRAFPKNGQTMNVCASFECEIDITKGITIIQYHNIHSTESIDMVKSDFPRMPKTIIKLPLKRDEIAAYINENLIAVFGEGAGQKSLENFFGWYDKVVPSMMYEKSIADAKRERTLRMVAAFEAECKAKKSE